MGLEISEFKARASDFSGGYEALTRPAPRVQPSLSISLASEQSQKFADGTSLLRLYASADCRIKFYAEPEGTDDTEASADDEFFPAGEHTLPLANGINKIAVVAA